MATTGRNTLAELIAEKVREAVAGALKDVQPELEQIAKDAGTAGATGIVGDIGSLSKLISDVALAAVVLDPPVGVAMEAVNAAEKAGGKWAIGSALGYMLGYTAFEMLSPLFLPIQHAVGDAAQTEIFDPNTAAMLESKGIIDNQYGRSEAAGGNLSGEHYDKLADAAHSRPALAELLDLLNRGTFDNGEVEHNLTRLGYDPPTVAALMTLRRNLLSPADLALAVLRGDIDHDKAIAYVAQLGVDQTDFDLLLGNVGEPPGTMDLLEAYRRGFIDKAQLEHGIRQSRVRNEWIPTIEALRRSPMSTADAVRAVVENYISSDAGRQIAEQNGLMPEHWPIMVESWGRPLAHMEMANLVFRGEASRAQFDQAMRESDIKDKYINQSFEIAYRLLPVRQVLDAIKHKAVTLQEGAKMLLQQGYTQESVAIIIKLGVSEQHTTAHTLTRAQITTLYADAILSRADALKHLETLGYNATDAEYMLRIVDVQQHAKEVRAETTATRTEYLAGSINANQAETQLHAAGLTLPQAQHAIATWDKEKRRAARSLSEAQIVKAATSGVFTPTQAISTLEAIGYSRADAATLLLSHGVPVTK